MDVFIKQYTNNLLPHYFIYAKDKSIQQVDDCKPTSVNYLNDIIPNPRIRFSNKINKLDMRILLHDKSYEYKDVYQKIIDEYDYLNSHKYKFYNALGDKDELNYKKQDSYIYQQIKNKLLCLPFSVETIVDTLVYFLYSKRKNSSKKTLWECFGKEIYENISNNVSLLGSICPICGSRIEEVDNVEKKYCCEECADIARREYWRDWKRQHK